MRLRESERREVDSRSPKRFSMSSTSLRTTRWASLWFEAEWVDLG
jgi:hypothetical protein